AYEVAVIAGAVDTFLPLGDHDPPEGRVAGGTVAPLDDAVTVAPSNEQQLRAWDGDEGAFWAAEADRYDRAVADHHRALLAAAAIDPDDHVLDVGCGTGQVARDAARAAPGGAVLGVDLSSRMLAVARRRAGDEGL